jgi:putative membrane protein
MHSMGGIGWLVLTLFWGFFLLALLTMTVLAIVWLLRSLRTGPRGPGGDDALAILRRRYASGEIDEEEYTRRNSTLSGKRGKPRKA